MVCIGLSSVFQLLSVGFNAANPSAFLSTRVFKSVGFRLRLYPTYKSFSVG